MSLSPLDEEHGKVSGKLVVLREITQRVQAEQERKRLILELQEALNQVKILNELLPR
ncbi:MAG: hypothetical protein HXX20_00590 [Chloroflexi bacterium]|nr:hypothetical protein [Chloroflexota bacterium]